MRWLPGFGEVAKIGLSAGIPTAPPGLPDPFKNARKAVAPDTREGSMLVSPNSLIDPSAEDKRKSSLLGG